jgi:hypothetical protein
VRNLTCTRLRTGAANGRPTRNSLAPKERPSGIIEENGINQGLATADGKILYEPQFHDISEPQDGMIRVQKWSPNGGGIGYLNDQGKMVIPLGYSQGTLFQDGVAIVTKHDGQMALINRTGKELRDFAGEPFSGGGPEIINGVLRVADSKGFVLFGMPTAERLRRMSWGYIDLTGKAIAWHNPEGN